RDINDWTIYRYNHNVGSERTINTYNAIGVHYRHDTRNLYPINPGKKIFITEKGNYQIAIVEYDKDEKVLKDNGYKNGEIVLSNNTNYISLVCSTKDFSHVSLEEMLESNALTIEIALDDYSKLEKYSHYDDLKENLISLDGENWENGSYSSSAG